jgi:serine/threonine protein phosphatase 1
VFKLFQKFKNPNKAKTCRIPDNLRVYAIGDIHGRADLLKRLHEMIAADASGADGQKENKVVYLGDYLDRGPYVRETLDEIISGLDHGFQTEYLKGNHEEIFLNFLENASLLSLWLNLGGQSTLLNYRVASPGSDFSGERAEAVRLAVLDAMPQEHLSFLKNLKPYVQIGDFLFVHAGIRPGIPLDKQKDEDLFWIRYEFTTSRRDHGIKIVHGHTINDKVQERANRIGIDTGAYATGTLSCAVLEDDRVRFLSTG